MSKDRFSNDARQITGAFIQVVAVSDQLFTTSQTIVLLDAALSEKVAVGESKWIFKLAELDVSHRSGDH